MKFAGKSWDEWAVRERIVALYLHGSQTSKPRPDSDIDLALLLSGSKLWDEAERIREEAVARLSEALGVPENQLDLQILNEAPPVFQYRVIAAKHLLWEGDAEQRIAFEREATREYLDLQFYLDQHDEARSERLREGTFGRRPEIHPTPSR